MTKRKAAILAIFLLSMIGIVGETIAFFNNKSEFENKFIADKLSVEANEDFTSPTNWLPGDTTEKIVRAHNTSRLPMAVRISYTERWEDQESNLLPNEFEGEKAAIVNLDNEDDWILETKDNQTYYYYYKVLNPDEVSSEFMKSVTFNENAIGGMVCTPREDGRGEECKSSTDYEGANYYLNIKIEFIHYDKYKENWDTDIDIDTKPREYLYDKIKNEAVIDNIASKYVSSSLGISFTDISRYTNGFGIYLRAGTENDEYPIYYYRGVVEDNNVLFANYCWKIVRTTETGGIKLVYYGKPIGENKNQCDINSKTISYIGTSYFNSQKNDPKYLGYTYGGIDSTIKTVIDNWYENNILNKYDSYLEDTIWCNDRSKGSTTGYVTYYGAYERTLGNRKGRPSLVCPQQADRYTLKNTALNYNAELNGNKLLNYPIALLTLDEVNLSGESISSAGSSYLNSTSFWLMSPHQYHSGGAARMATVSGDYAMHYMDVNYVNKMPVRPSLSLKKGTLLTEGNGTISNPYIIKTATKSN